MRSVHACGGKARLQWHLTEPTSPNGHQPTVAGTTMYGPHKTWHTRTCARSRCRMAFASAARLRYHKHHFKWRCGTTPRPHAHNALQNRPLQHGWWPAPVSASGRSQYAAASSVYSEMSKRSSPDVRETHRRGGPRAREASKPLSQRFQVSMLARGLTRHEHANVDITQNVQESKHHEEQRVPRGGC